MSNTYALITGAAGGLGKSFAVACAKRGYDLILVDLPGTKIESLAHLISQTYGIKAHSKHLDLSFDNAVDDIKKWVERNQWNVRLLINNVGIGLNQTFESMGYNQVSQLIDVNVKTTAKLSYAMLPFLEANKESYILNVGSMAGFYALPNKSIYSGTKAFIRLFSLSLRMELANKGVKVGLLCPGGILSNIDQYNRYRTGDSLTRLSYLYPDEVANEAISKLLKGKAIIMPGLFNRLVWRLTSWMPWSLQEKVAIAKFKTQ